LISLISVLKSEFSRDFGYPTMRNAAQTSPTPHPTAQSLWERVPSSCGHANDGNHRSFDGGDGKVDGTDNNSIVNASQHVSAIAASAQSTSHADDDSTFAQETKDILHVTLGTVSAVRRGFRSFGFRSYSEDKLGSKTNRSQAE
jgi:hypothetical protein